jgi:hypothetical protein
MSVEKIKSPVIYETGPVIFCFHPADDRKGEFRVYTKTPEEEKKDSHGYGDYLCEVERYFDDENRWKVKPPFDVELPPEIGYVSFKSKEEAAYVYYCYQLAITREKARHPLPDNIRDYLTKRARSLRERKQALLSQLIDLAREQHDLLEFSRQFNLDHVEWCTEESDAQQACKELIDFKIDDETLIEHIYNTFGKDAGRAYRGHLDAVVQFVDPTLET